MDGGASDRPASVCFHRVARPAILAASRSDGLRRTAERLPVTRDVVHRFVPGETVADALNSVAQLRDSHRLVSIDYLGEDTTDGRGRRDDRAGLPGAARRARRARRTRTVPLRPLEVSLKLSALGQALPRDGEKIALENAHTICERAQRVGAWVTVDAEDHTTTDSTLSIVRELRAEFPWLGTVLQSYLKRTQGDCEEFAASGARIRLCKGAYDEPASVAFRDRDEVTDSYLRCLRVLMAGSGYPMVASHDPEIIDAVPGAGRVSTAAASTISSTRCSTASVTPSSGGWPTRATTSGSTFRSARSGTATSCAGSPNGPPT